MPFCPVPHTSREQAWLVIGACAGALVARTLARRSIRRALLGPPEARRAHVWLVIELGVHDPSRFFAAFNQLSAATLAERGCVRYELLKETPAAAEGPSSPLDASRYTLVSEWETQEALDAHNDSVHFREYVPVMRRAADVVLRKLHAA